MDAAAADVVAPARLIVNSNAARIDDSMVFDFILKVRLLLGAEVGSNVARIDDSMFFDFILKVLLWLLGTLVVLFVLDDRKRSLFDMPTRDSCSDVLGRKEGFFAYVLVVAKNE